MCIAGVIYVTLGDILTFVLTWVIIVGVSTPISP
jgi:hypothetical protein